MIEHCAICDKFMFVPPIGAPHVCPPKFQVICDDYDPEEVEVVFAADHEDAAEKWAGDYDSADFDCDVCYGRYEPVVRVRRIDEENWRTFKVSGEVVPSYSAEEEL